MGGHVGHYISLYLLHPSRRSRDDATVCSRWPAKRRQSDSATWAPHGIAGGRGRRPHTSSEMFLPAFLLGCLLFFFFSSSCLLARLIIPELWPTLLAVEGSASWPGKGNSHLVARHSLPVSATTLGLCPRRIRTPASSRPVTTTIMQASQLIRYGYGYEFVRRPPLGPTVSRPARNANSKRPS